MKQSDITQPQIDGAAEFYSNIWLKTHLFSPKSQVAMARHQRARYQRPSILGMSAAEIMATWRDEPMATISLRKVIARARETMARRG